MSVLRNSVAESLRASHSFRSAVLVSDANRASSASVDSSFTLSSSCEMFGTETFALRMQFRRVIRFAFCCRVKLSGRNRVTGGRLGEEEESDDDSSLSVVCGS